MVTAIVQARVGSTRLPNKIFADIEGKPLLEHIIDRMKKSKRIQKVGIATTTHPLDDSVATWATNQGIPIYRGSENDVLTRYREAARAFDARIIARITADDPFKDPAIQDQVIDLFEREHLDFAYNNSPPSFPEGLDTEIFSREALERAFLDARDPFEREHVTQYFYRNPNKFKQRNLAHGKNLSRLRWTIDTLEDLEMARRVYRELYRGGHVFLMEEILDLLNKKPEIPQINQDVKRSAMYQAIPSPSSKP